MEIVELSFDEYNPVGSLGAFWTYYRGLRSAAGDQVPVRTEFDPLKIPSVLPKLAVSEYVDKNTQEVRLIGGGHDSLWPEHMAGKNLFDFLEPHMIEARQTAYEQIINRPCAVLLEDEATDSEGHTILYEGLVVPTLTYDGRPTIFIGCYDFKATDMEMQVSGEAVIVHRDTKRVTYIDLALSTD